MNKTKIYLLLTTALTLNTVSNTEASPTSNFDCYCLDNCISYCYGQYYDCCQWEKGFCNWGHCNYVLKEDKELIKENNNIKNVKVKDKQQIKFEVRIEVPQINRQ